VAIQRDAAIINQSELRGSSILVERLRDVTRARRRGAARGARYRPA
jgi:hypothetical protein